MNAGGSEQRVTESRVAPVPAEAFKALAWIGPMLMILGGAIGSGELLSEPAAGSRYGGALFWVILFAVITKAFWNEAIGRVSIATGQSFLEVCSSAGPAVAWVPWVWYAVNLLKDCLLRGGIMAIAGLVCFELFGQLPAWLLPPDWLLPQALQAAGQQNSDALQVIVWTFLNLSIVWLLLFFGGYRVAETVNTSLCLVLTVCLIVCALAVLPKAAPQLADGLVPSWPRRDEEFLMLVSLIGIVMSGSATMCYTVWVEERGMGLFGYVRRLGRRLKPDELKPVSDQEIQSMRGWLRVNRINVGLSYGLGLLMCCSTFILGIAVLGPAGVTLQGTAVARELSLMMTSILGPWARIVFYLGIWAAVISTIIAVLDGSPRMLIQPLRQRWPRLFCRLSPITWQRLLMTVMSVGSLAVYVLIGDILVLVLWLGAVDAPLVGILILAYSYLALRYIPRCYRSGILWGVPMLLVGIIYIAIGLFYAVEKLSANF